ncbi:MAG: Ku protein, partial [Gemmatimonadetes bacterium]|nr:Ku protein [Gemmatimonadota bacterium]
TQTVDITDFVELDDIDPEYFDKPYYLAPSNKKNVKAYALLREALKRAKKVGIAKVVIRSREYLAAVIPHGQVLILEILRYPHEIRGTNDLELPGEDLQELGVNDREIQMAEMLIGGMTSEWDPSKYHDTYRDDLMALIQKRIESGQTEVLDETPVEDVAPRGDVIDIMALLKKSVEATQRERTSAAPAAADTSGEPAGDDEGVGDEDEERPAARKGGKAAKPKSAEPAKPRTRTRKTA